MTSQPAAKSILYRSILETVVSMQGEEIQDADSWRRSSPRFPTRFRDFTGAPKSVVSV